MSVPQIRRVLADIVRFTN